MEYNTVARKSKLPLIPSCWSTFPRRAWPISPHYFKALRTATTLHYDCYAMRNPNARNLFALVIIASKHGHSIVGVTVVHVDLNTGRASYGGKDLSGYVPVLARDDSLIARVCAGLGELIARHSLMPALPGYARVSVQLHWHNAIRRAPSLSESSKRYSLPDIL